MKETPFGVFCWGDFMRLIISTFNIQNKFYINKYNGIDKYGNHVKELVDFIDKNNIDIMATQELTKRFINELKTSLKDNIIGKYRFKNISNYIPGISKFNETNSIITKHSIIYSKTKRLPFLFDIPRIMNIADIKVNNKVFRVISTHLSHRNRKVRVKQLNKLYKELINHDNIILMGDFNITTDDIDFKSFIDKIKNKYKRVDLNESTHKVESKSIDHIFIPNNYKIINKKVLNIKEKISDHKPIIVEIEI